MQVEARAVVIEEESHTQASAILDAAAARELQLRTKLDGRERDLAGLSAVLEGREQRSSDGDRDLARRLISTRTAENAVSKREAEVDARVASVEAVRLFVDFSPLFHWFSLVFH